MVLTFLVRTVKVFISILRARIGVFPRRDDLPVSFLPLETGLLKTSKGINWIFNAGRPEGSAQSKCSGRHINFNTWLLYIFPVIIDRYLLGIMGNVFLQITCVHVKNSNAHVKNSSAHVKNNNFSIIIYVETLTKSWCSKKHCAWLDNEQCVKPEQYVKHFRYLTIIQVVLSRIVTITMYHRNKNIISCTSGAWLLFLFEKVPT